jgi:hypothetical protein
MQLVTVEDVRPAPEFYRALEEGNIVFFPRTPWKFAPEDEEFLRGIGQTSASFHKNVAYRPGQDKVSGFDPNSVSDPERLRGVLRRLSDGVIGFLKSFVPRYVESCRLDYASFRGIEEEGRDLPLKKRNDLLHTDAFPTRPTGGDLILRTFANIHPSKSRVWMTSDPFASVACQHAAAAGWPGMTSWDGLKKLFTRRSAYDRFMLHFHDYLKSNREYQRNCPKYRWEFPPGSAWMVFTDVVPHAVLSGQYAVEQTVIVKHESLLTPACAPIEILRSLGKN